MNSLVTNTLIMIRSFLANVGTNLHTTSASINFLFSTIIATVPLSLQAQNNVHIQVNLLDMHEEVISYANIGIVGTSTGTVSGPDGSFSLYLPENINEEQIVRISHLGYETKDYTVASLLLLNNNTIVLEESAFTLPEVEIRPEGINTKVIGHEKTNTARVTNFSISKKPNQNLGSAIGKKFNLGKKEVHLNSFRFFIAHNNFDTVRFRVEIFTLENGRPHRNISSQEIISESVDQKTGWVSVDLSSYNIYAKGKIAIAITWIYHSDKGTRLSMPNTFPVFGSTHYYRFGSQNKWKRFASMSSAMQLEIIY